MAAGGDGSYRRWGSRGSGWLSDRDLPLQQNGCPGDAVSQVDRLKRPRWAATRPARQGPPPAATTQQSAGTECDLHRLRPDHM